MAYPVAYLVVEFVDLLAYLVELVNLNPEEFGASLVVELVHLLLAKLTEDY